MGFDMNYKIKVVNEVENREVQDLFRELGGEWGSRVDSDHYDKEFLYLTNGIIEYDDSISEFESVDECEEITLPELRDLVVLKRNSIEDATHTGKHGSLWYLGFNKYGWRFDIGDNGEWELDNPKNKTVYFGDLKPIEKKEMKEYLTKTCSGKYKLTLGDGDIEIPEGAIKATLCNDFLIFWEDDYLSLSKKNGDTDFTFDEKEDYGFVEYMDINDDAILIWQRSESPNDKLASAERYRQAEVLPFIDDEPKNVKQGSIEQTLAQRQSQYGCFEDVAFVTQGMIELMRKCNYDKMPASHQMALSMIASKMARIVNGDFNHKDSWHDIGGYARLIEDEIFDDITEMPF